VPRSDLVQSDFAANIDRLNKVAIVAHDDHRARQLASARIKFGERHQTETQNGALTKAAPASSISDCLTHQLRNPQDSKQLLKHFGSVDASISFAFHPQLSRIEITFLVATRRATVFALAHFLEAARAFCLSLVGHGWLPVKTVMDESSLASQR